MGVAMRSWAGFWVTLLKVLAYVSVCWKAIAALHSSYAAEDVTWRQIE